MAEESERPPPWAGAPGYTPGADLPPHAPLPGAPPYPAREAPPPPPVGVPAVRTRLPLVLAAGAVWAVVDIVLVLVVGSPAVNARFAAGLALAFALTAAALRLAGRHRSRSFVLLLVAAAPIFWIVRALLGAVLG